MGATIYNKAFSVELSHAYYETEHEFQINQYLDIVPSAATAALMKNARFRFVRTAKGFTAFYQAYLDTTTPPGTEKPLVKLSRAQEFLFLVRIKESADFILNVTDLTVDGKKFGAGMKYMLDGNPGTTTLQSSLIDQVRPSVFTYFFRGSYSGSAFTGPVDITVKDEDDVTVFSFSAVASDPATGSYALPLDFSDEANGLYTITAVDSANTSHEVHAATLYIDNQLARENLFGLIRLKYANADDLYLNTGEIVYQYSFINRSVKWRYYIALKSGTGSLKVVDTSMTYHFDPDPGVAISNFSLSGYDTVYPFTSTVAIPFKETAISTIQLQKSAGSAMILDNLANAAVTGVDSNAADPTDLANAAAEIFIFLESIL